MNRKNRGFAPTSNDSSSKDKDGEYILESAKKKIERLNQQKKTQDLNNDSDGHGGSRVIYNNRYTPTANPTDLLDGSLGTMNKGFLTNVFGEMQSAQIPTMADGCYYLATPTKPSTQFKNDLDKFFNPATSAQLQDLTNMMSLDMYGDEPRISGYVGKYCNFHIFSTNAFGVGAPGSEGVQSEVLGAGTYTTRSSYAFGADAVGRGIGSPMEIRKDTGDDFQRSNRYIWRSEEAFNPLDVDPIGYNDTSDVPQQLRVFELRTTDLEL